MKATTASTTTTAKKKYERPSLTCYGKFKDLVQGTDGSKSDGAGAPKSRACWVAEVLYGVDDPRTHLVRAWLAHAARHSLGWSVFVAFYAATGLTVARSIARSSILRASVRPLFDYLVQRAAREASCAVRCALSFQHIP